MRPGDVRLWNGEPRNELRPAGELWRIVSIDEELERVELEVIRGPNELLGQRFRWYRDSVERWTEPSDVELELGDGLGHAIAHRSAVELAAATGARS